MLLDKRIPLGYIIKKVRIEMILSMSFVLVIIGLKQFIDYDIELPIAIPAFLGTAISLVLAFKLNQSYDRWWEARKIWGAIVNDSRSLIIQVKQFIKGDDPSNNIRIKKIGYVQMAWCFSLSNSLKKLDALENLDNYLSNEEFNLIKNHVNVPLKLIDINASYIKDMYSKGLINEFQQIQIDKTLVRLCASMGKAERIKNTVFPKTYLLFLRFFIYIFILSLAVALSNINPIFEMGLLCVIALPFFLLKKTANHLQDPFENRPTDTSTYAISQTIETNIRQLLDEKIVLPKDKEIKDFYVM